NIIRRSGLRQMATQLAHEAISDYLAEPAKLPYAIVPFNPNQVPNRPVLFEPAYLLDVKRTYNFIWGEPIDDGLLQGDPDKRIGLVQVGNQWRAILKFAPVMDANNDGQVDVNDIRIYREVRYEESTPDDDGDGRVDEDPVDGIDNDNDTQTDEDPPRDFIFHFDPSQNQTVYISPTNRPKVLRVTYTLLNPVGPISEVKRELYLVSASMGQFILNAPASDVMEVVEEYPIAPASFDSSGVLTFLTSTPAPPNVRPDQLGCLRVDYLIDDPVNSGGHWIVETGTTSAAQGGSVFQTTLGELQSVQVVSLMPPTTLPVWGTPITAPSSDLQSGMLFFPNIPSGTRLRVAYRTQDNPNTPINESWFVQVIKPASDFQIAPDNNLNSPTPSGFPFERLRWFSAVNNNTLRFSPLLSGLNVTVRYRNAAGVLFEEVRPIGADGLVNLSQSPNRIEGVFGSSLLVRISGRSMWTQSPPRTKADYVELSTIVPPVQPSQP
ncbi:MAG: hypothetical protein NZ937_09380, partial [Armatimonadetes bacterium]|nr:hypothetical protein [Armatimonadota bacterium]